MLSNRHAFSISKDIIRNALELECLSINGKYLLLVIDNIDIREYNINR